MGSVNVGNKGTVAIVRLESPERHNRLTVKIMDELCALLAEMAHDESCRAVVLTGSENVFCGGGDLGSCQDVVSIQRFAGALTGLLTAVAEFPGPIAAAVNGDAFGGGMSLLEACDLAVCTPQARFALPEIRDGLAPMISLLGVRNQLGRKRCMELGALGVPLDAGEALRLGLINRVCELGEDAVEQAYRLLEPVLEGNLFAYAQFKKCYIHTQGMTYREQLECASSYLVAMLQGSEGGEKRQ